MAMRVTVNAFSLTSGALSCDIFLRPVLTAMCSALELLKAQLQGGCTGDQAQAGGIISTALGVPTARGNADMAGAAAADGSGLTGTLTQDMFRLAAACGGQLGAGGLSTASGLPAGLMPGSALNTGLEGRRTAAAYAPSPAVGQLPPHCHAQVGGVQPAGGSAAGAAGGFGAEAGAKAGASGQATAPRQGSLAGEGGVGGLAAGGVMPMHGGWSPAPSLRPAAVAVGTAPRTSHSAYSG